MWSTLALVATHAEPLSPAEPAWEESPEDSGLLVDPGLAEDLPDAVVGGRPVRRGRWDDAVGIVMFGQVSCTGTLIGPKVVLTAEHCTGYPISDVLVGSKDWLSGDGELVPVKEVIPFPNGLSTYDIAVVLLEREVRGVEPRPIAMECVLEEHLRDGAPVQIVGFGVTTESGRGFNTVLHEAPSEVLDANCNQDVINGVRAGCNASVSPGGEIAAGGNGTDACFGDSGGPLYLKTPDGDFLVGVTSRAFLGVSPSLPCRDGGIWARPDAVIRWIEEQVGPRELAYPSCNLPPAAEAVRLEVRAGDEAVVDLAAADPDGSSDALTYRIAVEPAHGTAQVDAEGAVTYVADQDYEGEDALVVEITDGGNPAWKRTGGPRSSEVEVSVLVSPAGCGGCDQGAPGSAGWAAAAGLALAARRRRG